MTTKQISAARWDALLGPASSDLREREVVFRAAAASTTARVLAMELVGTSKGHERTRRGLLRNSCDRADLRLRATGAPPLGEQQARDQEAAEDEEGVDPYVPHPRPTGRRPGRGGRLRRPAPVRRRAPACRRDVPPVWTRATA